MNKEENKIVPALRFPNFENSGDWKRIKLVDVTDKKIKWSFIGGSFGSNLKSSDYVEDNDGVRIIQLQNIGDGQFINKSKIFTSEKKANELLSSNVYPGEILMSKMGDPVGRACLIPDFHSRYLMCSDGIRIVVDENNYNKFFIYTLINSDTFRSLILNSSTGSTRRRIGLSILKNISMTVPNTKEEQQKIANCLSSLDNVITAETEKLDHFKDHKKGLLQRLFPAKGATKPQLRFPEFENDGDWEVDQLGDVTTYFKGYAFKSKDYQPSGRKIIRVSDMGYDYIKEENKTMYITEENAKQYKNWELKENDLIITTVGSKPPVYDSLVGRSIVVKFKDKGSLLNQNAVCLRTKKIINQNFLNNQFTRSTYISFIESIIRGNANQGSITLDSLFKFNVAFPKNPKEQQKIADCFSSADDLIATQTSKVAALKDHKKGLMQQFNKKEIEKLPET